MTWQEEIEIGMKLIKSGCLQCHNCYYEKCPFLMFCPSKVDSADSPEEWKIEGEENE